MNKSEANAGSKLPPAVVKLGWVSLFTDIASEMAYPLIPLFLTSVLRAQATALGAVEGVAEATVSLMNGLSGWRSDRIRRRVPFVRWGYGLRAVSKLILSVSVIWPMVMLGRALDRFGKGLSNTPRDALIADVTSRRISGRAFGLHRAMDSAGAVIGVLVSALLLYLLPGQYRLIFALTIVPGIVAVLITLSLREASGSEAQAPAVAAAQAQLAGRSRVRSIGSLPGSYWRTFVLLNVFALANSSDTFLFLRARNLGLGDVSLVLAYALYNLVYAATSYPAGALSDRIGRWRIIGLGWFLYAVVYSGFAAAGGTAVWGLFALYGIYMGMTYGVGKALVADCAPPDLRGTALGLFHLSTGLVTMLSSLLAGILYDQVGPAAPFWFGGAVGLVAVVLVPALKPRKE